ncbi:hypothetical protein N8Q41_22320 [Enterobacter hormaechei subsp. steigerwaltii]|uniref:hypothetical protein n=1 Tax=Enterobacter hormaechei TaxID=158836 RepID=UPI0012562B61|nr:hypothetical protein [Enterobacter hormaechei]MCU2465684.1 hypothetical protein [Enterobacter hormaechei subsp. steigerwaltii]MCU4097900.1 hypothetical protein [Enterobacter hormaechei subsp. steigerwaltii]MCU4097957.1 hypothetical protein [Enterobacter hormaechei subsp. steigerwaltii]VAG56027.1 Uncharacterised protein [Enterobacter hormaechei]
MNSDYISYETLIAARESAYWAKLSMYGTWFSGVATFLAVITSLCFALRDRKAFIGGKVRYGHLITEDDDKPVIGVTVVNRSLHPIRIKAIYWDVGGDNDLQQLFKNTESDPLPIRLENGDEANYRIIIDDDDSWPKRMAMRLKKLNKHPYSLRCVVALSTGERLRLKVDKRVKSRIQQYM